MSPALEAAFRLACTLPKKTHLQPEPASRYGNGRVPDRLTPAKKEQIKKMDREKRADGSKRYTRKAIACELRVGSATVTKVLGVLKTHRHRGGWK